MSKAQNTPATDPYARITNRILADLEQGVRPWTKPWGAGHLGGRVVRPLRATGEPYSGINVLLLWMEAVAAGYTSPTWMTYRQAQQLGAHVRKGETGTPVVYYGQTTRTRRDNGTGEEAEQDVRFLKTYTVFNLGQIEDLPERFQPVPAEAPALPAPERIASADTFFAATGAEVRHGGSQAYYTVTEDRIQMPPFEAFRDAESYYATLGHETVHWTRHPSRLDRSFSRKRWGDEGYSREELVAELGSAFLAADLGLYLEPREDHAAYIAEWIKALQNDKRAIVSAAAHAERAVKYLHGLQPGEAAPREAEAEAAA